MAAADLRKDRRLIFIVTVLANQSRNAKHYYVTQERDGQDVGNTAK
jgi:hypothetical protein